MKFDKFSDIKEKQIPLIGNHRVTFSTDKETLIGFHLNGKNICYIYSDEEGSVKYLKQTKEMFFGKEIVSESKEILIEKASQVSETG